MIAPGTRNEKGYPLTRDELWLMGSLGVGTTAIFSVATGLIGYYVNTGVNLALAQGVPRDILAAYETSRSWALAVALACYGLGAAIAALGGLKVVSVIRRTTHDE